MKVGILATCSLFILVGVLASALGEGAQGETPTMNVKFPWSEDAVTVSYSLGYETFVYTSAYPQSIDPFDSGSLFVYYEEGLSYGRGDMVILDLDPHEGENNTFMDLYFDESLRTDLERCLCGVVENLSLLGVRGFVLGDEWPRGLNNEEITIQRLSRYNQTYHDETGRWMRTDPSLVEKMALADWFYDHSIQAWNALAWGLRHRFSDVYLGTNMDLVWEPDYARSDVAHWKAAGWWGEVDLEPYDFVVTHYFTKMKNALNASEDMEVRMEMLADGSSIARLQGALESLLDPVANTTQGRDVFLMLGAHCTYPYVTTPMQMVQEWNAALEFGDRLKGVGWFTFDLWGSPGSIVSRSISGQSNAPMRDYRFLTLEWFLELNRYGRCAGWDMGLLGGVMTRYRDNRGYRVIAELGRIEVVEGEEAEFNITIHSFGPEGNVCLVDLDIVSGLVVDYYILGNLSGTEDCLGFLPSGGNLSVRISITVYKEEHSRDPFCRNLRFGVAPCSCSEKDVLDWRPVELPFKIYLKVLSEKEVSEVFCVQIVLLLLWVLVLSRPSVK